ncbi:hypothetical protein [Flavisolibacter ginsenosidimutans]|uniref:Uncharacterized protein n=1 Tax=Flavisolibacter ginsenosidimutans TaxID=661481 RepID=A0A5B8UNX3_9BACT|nr:hypothetical protein [Flavisolibacter ginsenosidimutans]QEC58377.1 hypothetical protein FSB75_21545 [Flavisolibacter ginsenosidimutans]
MKTVFDKLPLSVPEGKSVTVSLPEPFRTIDCLFLLVHNSLGQVLTLTLTKEGAAPLTQSFKLTAFPAILVFPSQKGQEQQDYNSVTITSFQELDGSLTFRSKNPAHIINAYRPDL